MADATTMRLHAPETESTVIIIGQRKIRVRGHDEDTYDDIEMSENSEGSLLYER